MERRGRVSLRLRCDSDRTTCFVKLTASHGRPLAFRQVQLRSGRANRVRLRLPPGTRRSVRRHRKGVLLRVSARASDDGGGAGSATRRVRVLRRRAP
jgi:hypothetical protein